jgi:hypothetical protein
LTFNAVAEAPTKVPNPAIKNRFPFLDLKAQFKMIAPEVMAAVEEVFASQHFIMGPQVESLETELAQYIGCRYAVGCASGSDALLLALMALEVDSGDEVITHAVHIHCHRRFDCASEGKACVRRHRTGHF